MSYGMYPTVLPGLEETLLRKALEQHVHRSDPREGMKRNTRTLHGVGTDLKEDEEDEHNFQSSMHHTKSESRRQTNRKQVRKQSPRSPKGGLDPKPSDVGTVEIMTYKSGAASLRCRISKCINLDSLNQDSVTDELKGFFQRHCEWKPMPLQVFGGVTAEHVSVSRPPTPRRDIGGMREKQAPRSNRFLRPTTADELFKERLHTQQRMTFQGKKRRNAMPALGASLLQSDSLKDLEKDASSWDFVRHLPASSKGWLRARAPRILSMGKGQTLQEPADLFQYQMLFSDVKALLEDFGDECKAEAGQIALIPMGTPTALEFVKDVPRVTQSRWAKILKASAQESSDKEALARLLTMALRKEPEMFKVTAPKILRATDSDAASKLQLVISNEFVQSALASTAFVLDCDSRGGRDAREIRFCSVMNWLRLLPDIAGVTVEQFDFSIEEERLSVIAKAVDRAESSRLRGGLAAVGDRTKCVQFGSKDDNSLRCRRGAGGVTPDWLLAAIAQASDDEGLEAGDNLRLLTEIVASKPGEVGDDGHTEPHFGYQSWLDICGTLGLLNRRNSADDKVDVEEVVARDPRFTSGPTRRSVSEEVSTRRLSKSSFDSLSSIPQQPQTGQQLQADQDATSFDAVDDCEEVFEAVAEIVGDVNGESHAPILLELLLQLAARTWPGRQGDEVVPGGSGALVSALLWFHCGWDSPIGRKLIRQLCIAYNRYAEQGVLSKNAFIQLATDAGWVTKRDMSARFERLSKAFGDVMGKDVEEAEFTHFVLMVEQIAIARSDNFDLQHGHEPGLVPIPGPPKHWPFIERAVLQVANRDEEPTCPMWVRGYKRSDTAQSKYARSGSRTSKGSNDDLNRRGSQNPTMARRQSLPSQRSRRKSQADVSSSNTTGSADASRRGSEADVGIEDGDVERTSTMIPSRRPSFFTGTLQPSDANRVRTTLTETSERRGSVSFQTTSQGERVDSKSPHRQLIQEDQSRSPAPGAQNEAGSRPGSSGSEAGSGA